MNIFIRPMFLQTENVTIITSGYDWKVGAMNDLFSPFTYTFGYAYYFANVSTDRTERGSTVLFLRLSHRLGVCLSVCLSVRHTLALYQIGDT